MIEGCLADDRLRLLAQGGGDGRSVLVQLAEGRVARQHPVRGPADGDRGRPRVHQGVRRAAQDRPARVRPGEPGPARRERQPGSRDLAERRRAPDHHLADRLRDVAGGLAGDLDQLVGQAALVDQDQRVRLEPERAAEAGRQRRRARRGPRRARRPGSRRGRRVGQDRVRHLLGRLAERAGGADERCRGPHRIARHLPEEAAAGEAERFVAVRRRRGRGRRGRGGGLGGQVARAVEVAHRSDPGTRRWPGERSVSTGSPT